ncbi:MAG: hypothetical protein FWG22_03710 [Prolixibacteraceae bacterium]|nr:hypothetical protein [Prolixibacteraceae bacterium]
MYKYLFVLALLIPVSLFGQPEEKEQKTFSVGISPFTAVINGLQVDFDLRLKNKHWLTLSPQFYMNNDKGSGYWWYSYENMYGLGIDLQHRIYLRERLLPKGFYLSYGPTFKFFSVDAQGYYPEEYTENGSQYIGFKEGMLNTKICKVGGNIIFGYQFVFFDIVYLDLFTGTGIRLSYDNRTSGLHKMYNYDWPSIGYSGTLLVGGFRVGITF